MQYTVAAEPRRLTDVQTTHTTQAHIRLARRRAGTDPAHLWVYAGHVDSVHGDPRPGDLVDVYTPAGRFYARGLFNPHSKIQVRILTFDDEPVDEAFWRRRITEAVRLRTVVVSGTDAYRVVHAEGDRLPGLIVDRYADVLVMQTLSFGMDRRREEVADVLLQETGVRKVYLRNDAKTRSLEGLKLERGFLRGDGPTSVEIVEQSAQFLVDFERGQKTGWFCDQRENRLAAAKLCRGGEVLEMFCHTGAFGIHAALAGAAMVEGVDVGEEALVQARRHASLNGVESRCLYRSGDAFEDMRRLLRSGRRYDAVLLDPPAFARTKQAVPRALAGYKDVNLLAMRLVRPNGFLVTSSCSHHVDERDLWSAILSASRDAGRQIRLLEQRGQAPDHPVLAAMPETRYLKSFLLQVL